MDELGRHHFLVELSDCDLITLDDEKKIREVMFQAALENGATTVDNVFHRLCPQEVSSAVVIAESHLAIHKRPEFGCVAADLYTSSGDLADPWKAFHFPRKAFKARRSSQTEKNNVAFCSRRAALYPDRSGGVFITFY